MNHTYFQLHFGENDLYLSSSDKILKISGAVPSIKSVPQFPEKKKLTSADGDANADGDI